MTVPPLWAIVEEAMNAVVSKPETKARKGTPPRSHNGRKVIKGPIDLGDFERPEDKRDE